MLLFFFFNDTATTEIYTLSLHDALPILAPSASSRKRLSPMPGTVALRLRSERVTRKPSPSRSSFTLAVVSSVPSRSEEHTSELQSRQYLVCRLLLEKKKYIYYYDTFQTF